MHIVSICRESGIDWDQVTLDTKKSQTGGTLWDTELICWSTHQTWMLMEIQKLMHEMSQNMPRVGTGSSGFDGILLNCCTLSWKSLKSM